MKSGMEVDQTWADHHVAQLKKEASAHLSIDKDFSMIKMIVSQERNFAKKQLISRDVIICYCWRIKYWLFILSSLIQRYFTGATEIFGVLSDIHYFHCIWCKLSVMIRQIWLADGLSLYLGNNIPTDKGRIYATRHLGKQN